MTAVAPAPYPDEDREQPIRFDFAADLPDGSRVRITVAARDEKEGQQIGLELLHVFLAPADGDIVDHLSDLDRRSLLDQARHAIELL